MTKGAMGNLINRYQAVLWKCRVKNAMSRMVLAGALLAAPLFAEGLSSIIGEAGTARAEKFSLDNLANDFESNGKTLDDDAKVESSNPPGVVGIDKLRKYDEIYGGLATTPESQTSHHSIASANNLTVDMQNFEGKVSKIIAGYADNESSGDSTASNNILTIRGAESISFNEGSVAGYAENHSSGRSEATGNKLFVEDAIFKFSEVSPGLSGGVAELHSTGTDAIANNNEIHISGKKTKICTIVYGGKATTNNNSRTGYIAQANYNKVFIIKGAHVVDSIHAAQVQGRSYAEAHDNFVSIQGAFVGEDDDTDARYSVTAANVRASNIKKTYHNWVEILNSRLTGGNGHDPYSYSGKAPCVVTALITAGNPEIITERNEVKVTNSTITGYLYGTQLTTSTKNVEVSDTKVEVSEKSEIRDNICGDDVKTTLGNAVARGGRVSISSSGVGGNVIGAWASVDGVKVSKTSRASGYEVHVSGSHIGSSEAIRRAEWAYHDHDEDPSDLIQDKLDDPHISVIASIALNQGKGEAVAEGNAVTLQGGTYGGSIYGSYAYAAGNTASAGGNTITLQGNDVSGGGSPYFNPQNTVIWGSYAFGGNQVYAPGSPNTLNFIDAKGMTAANIRNFSILKYTLPNMKAQESVLTLTGGANNEKTDISNASVSIAVADVRGRDGGEFGVGGDKSPENDRIILLKNDNGLISDGWKQDGEITAREGVSLSFDLAAGTDDTSLYLYRPETIIDPTDPDHPRPNKPVVNPQTKALAEGWLAGLTLGIQAGNVAADQGIGAMRYAAVRLDRDGWLPFGVLEGGSVKYNSGSHIDLQSLSLLAGLGRGVNTDLGLLIVGGFFEYGTGSYKTHNTFDTMPSVDGSGNAWYMGGGLLASMDFKKTGNGHFYLEGSAHTGMLHNSFDGDALRDAYGRSAEFDTDTPYYNLHAGLGYLWNFAEDHTLDIYGKYYWTRVLGTEESLNTGDPVDFCDITSSRTRLGARYAYQATEHVSAYIGAAWEHEFEGVSDSSVFGYDIDSPKIRGDSGRGEIGLRFTPTDDLPLTVDLGVQGYADKKEGVTGSLFVQYEF